MAGASRGAVFEILDPSARGGAAALGGPWGVVEAPPSEVHFAIGGASPSTDNAAPIVWRVSLADASNGGPAADASSRMNEVDARVAQAVARAEALMQLRASREHDRSEHFAIGADDAMPDAERELLLDLDEPESFAPGEADGLRARVEGFLDDLWRRATTAARLETCIGARAVATTEVSFLGDVVTTLHRGASGEDARAHERSLTAVLSTRRAWLRIVVQTLQVALLIGSGNALLALPRAWRFIQGIIAEVERIRAAS